MHGVPLLNLIVFSVEGTLIYKDLNVEICEWKQAHKMDAGCTMQDACSGDLHGARMRARCRMHAR